MRDLMSSCQNIIFISCLQGVYAFHRLETGQIQLQPLQPTYFAAQPMVAGQAVFAGQQMVAAQPMVACQPLIAGQPVLARQQIVEGQPMVAGHQMVSAEPMVAVPVSNQ